MARENKRKRDERRFGRPERLADMVLTSTWFPPANGLSYTDGPKTEDRIHWESTVRWLSDGITKSPAMVVDNVADLVFLDPKQDFSWEDLPSIMPPFDRMLVEYAPPPNPCSPGLPIDGTLPSRVGVLVVKLTPGQFHAGFQNELMEADWNRVKFILWTHTFTLRDGGLVGPIEQNFIPVDHNGQISGNPSGHLLWKKHYEDQSRIKGTRAYLFTILYPAMLGLAFTNCKGVTVRTNDPDPAINRERKKHGKKPFVRFHTINIEPMRKVLRDEGGSETHGLKKALHICRGHFATYATSFLGRTLDKPVTVWKPAHVRGTAKEGIVVSDYRVNPADN